jgi:2,4-dienoyl-CoA reductase-like NADH-dependent reductase (Old Yellow Enzyme family)
MPRALGGEEIARVIEDYRRAARNADLAGFDYVELHAAGGFTPRTADAAVAADAYDLVAFGRWFLANPDLPERLRRGTASAARSPVQLTLGGGGESCQLTRQRPKLVRTAIPTTGLDPQTDASRHHVLRLQ